ncbi:unnamed protein product, partial [Brassica rapa subsp. narinosa]
RSIDVTGSGGVAVRHCSLESYLHHQALLTSRSISQPWSRQISFVKSKVTSPKSLNSPPSNPLSSSVDIEASSGCVFTHENRGEETKVHKL